MSMPLYKSGRPLFCGWGAPVVQACPGRRRSLVVHRPLSVCLSFPSIVHRQLTRPCSPCRPLAHVAMSTLVTRLAWFYPSCTLVVLLTPFADSFARSTSSRARHVTSCFGRLTSRLRASAPRAHHPYVPPFSNVSNWLDYHVTCIPFIQFYFARGAPTVVETTSPVLHHLSNVVQWGTLAFLRASRPITSFNPCRAHLRGVLWPEACHCSIFYRHNNVNNLYFSPEIEVRWHKQQYLWHQLAHQTMCSNKGF